jgi:DNA-binding IclR family transcriptional regulator
MSVSENGRSKGIQSVEIGLKMLAAVGAAGGPASLSALAQRAGLSASQAHRYLSGLIAAGMVRQAPHSGLYDLDAGAIRIGLAGLARLDTFASADAAVGDYVRASGRTCLVAVWGDAGPTVVRWFPGHPAVVTSLAVGSVLPVHQSATGRVFLAFGDRSTVAPLAAGSGQDVDGAMTARVRAEMLARLDGDLIPGLRVVSVPVFDLQGRLALVVTSIAHAAIPRDGDAQAEKALVSACRALTESLGGRWPAGEAG